MSGPIVPCSAYREHGFVCALPDGHNGEHLAQAIYPDAGGVAELSKAARAMRSAPVKADREDRFLLSVAAMLEIEAAFCEAEGVPPRPAPLVVARTYLATRQDTSAVRLHRGGPEGWPHA